eukprot:UN03263
MDAPKKSYITRNNMDEFDNIHEKLEFWDPVSLNNSKRKRHTDEIDGKRNKVFIQALQEEFDFEFIMPNAQEMIETSI